MQLCSGCNGRLAAMSSDVSVRFIVLPMEFDGSQGPVYGKKSGSIELKIASKQRHGDSRCDKRDTALRWLQRGHAVMLDEVLVRFIALPMEFDGMLGPVHA